VLTELSVRQQPWQTPGPALSEHSEAPLPLEPATRYWGKNFNNKKEIADAANIYGKASASLFFVSFCGTSQHAVKYNCQL
jgi:hypothetical protein